MPVMDGLEATRQIRAHERRSALEPCYIIALTAHATPEDRADALREGMSAFMCGRGGPVKHSHDSPCATRSAHSNRTCVASAISVCLFKAGLRRFSSHHAGSRFTQDEARCSQDAPRSAGASAEALPPVRRGALRGALSCRGAPRRPQAISRLGRQTEKHHQSKLELHIR